MSAPLDTVLAGGPLDFSEVPLPELRAWLARLEALRARVDVVSIGVGAEILARGTDKQTLARDLKLAKAPNPRQRADVAAVLPSLPAARAAFVDGKISYGHLVPLTHVQAHFPGAFAEVEADYVAQAAVHTPHGLRKKLVEFVKQHKPAVAETFDPELGIELRDRGDGRYELSGVLDTIGGQTLERALKSQKDALWRTENPARNRTRIDQPPYRQQLMKALLSLCEGNRRVRATLRSKYLMLVVVDYETLIHGLHAQSIATTANGIALSIDELRKLACDADIMPVIVGGDSIPIDLGKEQRWFSEHQHLAALVLHPTCVMCDVPAEDCAMHHMIPYPEGPTDMANALPLCASCHDLVHQSRLRLERNAGLVTSYRPDGSIYTQRAYNQYSTSPRELKLSA